MSLSRVSDPVFLIKLGVRSVSPYYFEYKTPFKERWRGKLAPQILLSELGQTEAAVNSAIDSGRIYITANNGKAGGPVFINGPSVHTHLLQGHDIIHNLQHCHEPNIRVYDGNRVVNDCKKQLDLTGSTQCEPVPKSSSSRIENLPIASVISDILCNYSKIRTQDEVDLLTDATDLSEQKRSTIPILFEDKNLVVISKPGGVPTHPGGIYRYNTVSEILAYDLQGPVWPCHRLDKSTLGVMVFAKSKKANSEYMKLFLAKDQVEKWYVARVTGLFPYTACRYQCPVFSVNSSGNGYINVSNQTQIPTNSTTDFFRVHYSKEHDFSLVLCRPITGRMHQIRIHLRNLGYAISNDNLYNCKDEMSRAKNNVELQLYTELWNRYPDFASPKLLGPEEGPVSGSAISTTISVVDFLNSKILQDINQLSTLRSEKDLNAVSGTCEECSRPLYAPNMDPDSGIWLHALALRWLQPENIAPSSPTQGLFFVAAPCPSWCA